MSEYIVSLLLGLIQASLKGIVDLIKMKAIIWKDETLGAEFEITDIPEDLKESANKYRKELVYDTGIAPKANPDAFKTLDAESTEVSPDELDALYLTGKIRSR